MGFSEKTSHGLYLEEKRIVHRNEADKQIVKSNLSVPLMRLPELCRPLTPPPSDHGTPRHWQKLSH